MDLWTLAQKFWWPDRRLIPEIAWKASELTEALIECGRGEATASFAHLSEDAAFAHDARHSERAGPGASKRMRDAPGAVQLSRIPLNFRPKD